MYFEKDYILYESRFRAILVSLYIRIRHPKSGLYFSACLCLYVLSLYFACVLLLTLNASTVSDFQWRPLKAPLNFQTKPLRWTAGEMSESLESHISVCICSVSSEAVKVKPNKQPSAIYAHITFPCSIFKL